MIIVIGYRVRSNIGTNFRKWATNTLNEYIVKGFAINDLKGWFQIIKRYSRWFQNSNYTEK